MGNGLSCRTSAGWRWPVMQCARLRSETVMNTDCYRQNSEILGLSLLTSATTDRSTISLGTIQYDIVYLTCSTKLTCS